MMRQILFVLMLAGLLVGTASAALPEGLVSDGLIAAYDFQQGAAPGTLYEISGAGYNGTIYGGATWLSEGLDLDGVNDYITLPDSGSIDTGHTLIVVLKENSVTGWTSSVLARTNDRENVDTGRGFAIKKAGLENHWSTSYYKEEGPNYLRTVNYYQAYNQTYPAWDVLIHRYDGETVTAEFNGRPAASFSLPLFNEYSGHSYYVGRAQDRNVDYLKATIGYILIYNRSLSDAEASSVYSTLTDEMADRGVALLPPPPPINPLPEELITDGLVAAYDFQQGDTPGALYDVSGAKHHGSIMGGATWLSEGLDLDGVNDYITLPDSGSIDTGHTLIVVLKENSVTGWTSSVLARTNDRENVDTGRGFAIKKAGLENLWSTSYYKEEGPNYLRTVNYYQAYNQTYPAWDVLIHRYDGETVTAEFNGRPAASFSLPSFNEYGGYSYYVGRAQDRNADYLKATIGYILIYNRSLSDAEASSVYSTLTDEMADRGVALLPPRRPIDPPMIALTFDDAFATDYSNVFRIAGARDIPTTSYIETSRIGTAGYLTWDQIREMRAGGAGVECHSHTHLSGPTEEEALLELQNVDAAFTAAGLPTPEHHAYPGGSQYPESVLSQFRETGRRASAQLPYSYPLVEWDEPARWYLLATHVMNANAGEGVVNDTIALIDTAIAQKTPLLLYTHRVETPAPLGGSSCLSNEQFTAIVDYIAAKRDAGLIDPVTIDGLYRAIQQGIRTSPATGPLILHGETTAATFNQTVDYVGFVWGTTRLNNPEGTAPDAAGYDSHWISASGDYVEDEFSHMAASYTPDIEYFYRSAAKIDGTWYYGEELTYTVPVSLPYVTFTYTADGDETATGTPIHFQSTISGDATSWQWDFKDGATSTELHPTHTFTGTGTYPVTLTATNIYGSSSFSHTFHVYSGTVSPPIQPATPTPTTWPYPPDPTPTPTLNSSAFRWDPETGYYTGYWFNREGSFIDVHGLFFSLLLPLTQIFGSWVFLIIWGTLCMGFYLYTQDTTMPFIVGVLGGAMMAFLMGEEVVVVMLLTMAFAGGGILAKVLLGRV